MYAAKLTHGSIWLFQKSLVRDILEFRCVPEEVAKEHTEDLSGASKLQIHVIIVSRAVCIAEHG
jgi:hypothetical protein